MKKALLATICLALFFALIPTGVAFAQESPPEVNAGAYVVMDADTGQVLISKNGDMAAYPASITKILTLGLVLENVDFEKQKGEVIIASDAAIDALMPRASMIALGRGEAATLEDLLYATMLESANDGANVLAEYISGSMDAFCQLMNQKAASLGLVASNFTNPSGQPQDAHVTTAKDMAQILRWALSVPGFKQIFSSQIYSMGASNMQPSGRVFRNSNLISIQSSSYFCQGVVGSKTGYTDEAQYTLATNAVRGDMNLVAVVLACPVNQDKYNATNAILDYCFNNFRRVSVPPSSVTTHGVPVFGGGEKPLGQIEVLAGGDISFLLHNSLAPTAAQFTYNVPEKYVIGQTFAPTASLNLGQVQQQDSTQVLAVPLVWQGLDKILAENTTLGLIAGEKPAVFWLAVLMPTFLALLFVARVAQLRYRRHKRRQRRLQAARAQMPVSIEERPQPPDISARPEKPYRRPSTPKLRVAKENGKQAEGKKPRRIGRAK